MSQVDDLEDLGDLDDLVDDQLLVIDEEELLAQPSGAHVPDDELNELVSAPGILPMPPEGAAILKEFEANLPDVSLINKYGSSLVAGPRRRVRFKDFAKLDLRNNPVKWAQHITKLANSQAIGSNPVDRLSETKILELTAALQQCEAKILEGYEAAIILSAPGAEFCGKPLTDVDRLALHLNAMGIDHVVILKLQQDTQALRRGLLQRGLREGLDYEFIEPTSLLPYERKVFDRLLSKSTSRLRLVRKVSKMQAKV